MGDRFPGLRYRPGDLAVIVQDEPECRSNIGQIVRVLGEYTEFPEHCGFYWEIQPLSKEPSAVLWGTPGRSDCEVIYDNEPRAHRDDWLRPLLNTDEPDEMTLIADLPVESEWRDPAHLRVT